jgi:S-adenosylmethionine-dependent methyltransferase
MKPRIDAHDPVYRARLTDVLREHYFNPVADGYLETEEGRNELNDHLSHRYEQAVDHVVPWLQRAGELDTRSIIEVGSGTGSSTLALAQVAREVNCFEIHQGSIAVALERLKFWGVSNVRVNATLFDRECEFVRLGAAADVIVFYAVLEHMTAQECLDALTLAWELLPAGGLLVVAETPNRLSMVDEHTSWLPFFAQLPRPIQVRYAERSPREHFRWAIANAAQSGSAAAELMMTRWGNGISFHEFELAIGPGIHDAIVLDGYEREIKKLVPVSSIDLHLQSLFDEFGVKAHRAFTRRTMYLVARKPSSGL